jgi:DNA polymerase-1
MKQHKDIETYIVTGDKDALQLVDDDTFVLSPKKAGSENLVYTKEEVEKKFGLTPGQIVDFKSLTGDPSDNIPGVMGIGDKGATTLLQKYETLDGIYDHLDDINGATHDKLETGKEDAYFSKKMVKLVKDVPIGFKVEDAKIHPDDYEKALPLFTKLNFRSLIGRLKKIIPEKQPDPAQTSLFDV